MRITVAYTEITVAIWSHEFIQFGLNTLSMSWARCSNFQLNHPCEVNRSMQWPPLYPSLYNKKKVVCRCIHYFFLISAQDCGSWLEPNRLTGAVPTSIKKSSTPFPPALAASPLSTFISDDTSDTSTSDINFTSFYYFFYT